LFLITILIYLIQFVDLFWFFSKTTKLTTFSNFFFKSYSPSFDTVLSFIPDHHSVIVTITPNTNSYILTNSKTTGKKFKLKNSNQKIPTNTKHQSTTHFNPQPLPAIDSIICLKSQTNHCFVTNVQTLLVNTLLVFLTTVQNSFHLHAVLPPSHNMSLF